MNYCKVFLNIIIVFLLVSAIGIKPVAAANNPDVETLLEEMTPEEKVGQLFLVTFDGMSVEEGTEIYELITQYHIGGVVLLAENNNFTSEDILSQTSLLIESLQRLEWDESSENVDMEDSENAYVPLFVGIPQKGNGFGSDEILSGLTQLPSQMSIGAAWDLNLATQVGQVMGSELSALGFNLYLGPNLDVLETENNEAANYLGVNTFGGDPFWVGELGKAFINGLHTGSENGMIVVAQNFPGTGYSDRSPEDEVATVRKSLEQLKQIELAPYFTVTSSEQDDPGRVDGLMVSHIRYQGFQGNIRATTKPISFDSNAFQQIMSLSQFSSWRENGGLMISDNLGSEAVRRFFDPNNENFDATQVARSAFLAGNDMLYVNDFIATNDPDAYTTLKNTVEFFVQKYREDSAFAQRVDSSVARILDVKLGLYEDFNYETVMSSTQLERDNLGESSDVSFNVAQNAVTLISPTAIELDTLLPSPPQSFENIVIFSDVRTVSQCDECPPINTINTNALANAMMNLYGPQASGQILQNNLYSYTFSQLVEFLDNVENGSGEYLSANLNRADWVIFNTLDVDPDYPASNALQRVLTERADLLSGKNVIVFALDAPIYLDATDISKVTAYYALYSKAPEFINVAARVLMQEIESPGALPVSLSAVGYDLISMTAPDPNQIIGLGLVLPEVEMEEGTEEEQTTEEAPSVTQTPEPTPMPSFTVGDTITIRTDPIYDHNHNIVPDGTIVRFNFLISGEPGITQQFETTTTAGVAYFNYRIEAAGGMEVNATSEPAVQSETLKINIEPDGSAEVIAISPTPLFSPTPTEGPTPTSTDDLSPSPTPTPNHGSYPTLGEWALGVIVMAIGSGLAFLIGQLWWGSTQWALRSGLCTLIGGLLTYTYLNIGFGGTKFWMAESGTIFVAEMVVVGLLMGWIAALIWWMRTEGRYPSRRR